MGHVGERKVPYLKGLCVRFPKLGSKFVTTFLRVFCLGASCTGTLRTGDFVLQGALSAGTLRARQNDRDPCVGGLLVPVPVR